MNQHFQKSKPKTKNQKKKNVSFLGFLCFGMNSEKQACL